MRWTGARWQWSFLVPPRLREYAKLDKKAMLVGQLNKFQLWDEDAGTRFRQPTLQLFNNRAPCPMICVT